MTDYHHISVMPEEAIAFLDCKPGHVYVDGTLGGGGHAMAILNTILPDGLLIGIDQDADAIRNATSRFAAFSDNIRLVHDNFTHLPDILSRLDISAVDGILLDLGLSLNQLENSGRGFSFKRDEPLDMRMDVREKNTAAALVNTLSEVALRKLIKEYGEEPMASRIARKIVAERGKKEIGTSRLLADIVTQALPPKLRHGRRIHPATKTFMALRIAVNKELERLEAVLPAVPKRMNPGARLCILTFHSLEDRIVKRFFQNAAHPCTCPPDLPQCVCHRQPVLRIMRRKALKPTAAEVARNPMARSVKLRVAEKI